MDLKYAGLALIVLGIVILVGGFVVGIVIGVNAQTQTRVENIDSDDFDSVDEYITTMEKEESNYETAEAANGFLIPFNMGGLTFGMGSLIAGAGVFFAGNNKGNMLVLGVAIGALVVLIVGVILMTVVGGLTADLIKIDNRDSPSDEEIERMDRNEEILSLLGPPSSIIGGWTTGIGWLFIIGGQFNFNSLAFVLPMLTLVLGAAVAVTGRRGNEADAVTPSERSEPDKDEGTPAVSMYGSSSNSSSSDSSSSGSSYGSSSTGSEGSAGSNTKPCPKCGGQAENYPGYGYYCNVCRDYVQ